MSILNYILKRTVLLTVLCVLLLTSCLSGGPKDNVGGIFGGVAGAAIGSHFGKGTGSLLGIGIGALAGSMIGGSIGKQMDETDKRMHSVASNSALESAPDGRAVAWNNPNNGHRGYVVANKTYQKASGEYCREFQQKFTVDGREQSGYGTACRQPDGTWKIVNEG